MKKASFGITSEGYPFLLLCAFSALLFAIIGCWPVALILLLITWISAHFFRDPERVSYYPGKFFNASLDKASQYNERCAYSIEGEDGNFAMVQIAGLVAQRIVPRVVEGDELGRGERFGMIKFGSRVDLYLPENYIPAVSLSQKVFAGQTVIAARQEDGK